MTYNYTLSVLMHPEEHKCFLLISTQQLTSLNLYVLMEKIKTMKVNPFVTTWYHSFLTSRLFGPVNQTHSLSVTWTKVSSPPAPRDLLVLYFWTSFKRGEKKKTVHPQTPGISLSNLPMILHLSSYFLPITTLTCTSPKRIDSPTGAKTICLN